MMFAKQNTETLPVPKIFACYSYGPINRDIEDHGSLFDTYIFMSFVESQTLDKVWESYDEDTKAHVTNQLKEYLLELRQIRNGSYIGSANSGPVTDQILESYHVKGWHLTTLIYTPVLIRTCLGPFDSEENLQ